MPADPATQLARFLDKYARLTVLSGAGCSTASGIPEYRDDNGQWKHARPMQYTEFMGSEAARRRYWARSYAGWRRVAEASPNAAHHALARLEGAGVVDTLVTQNVDNLHRRAGSRCIIDLHGVLDNVRCTACGDIGSRAALQERLESLNPQASTNAVTIGPDGDAQVPGGIDGFIVPDCENCGGILKPDVVFFGESVPRERVELAYGSLRRANALLVVGSSLMVFSGFRFVRQAHADGQPIAVVNRGRTRADEIATLRLNADCGSLLADAANRLAG